MNLVGNIKSLAGNRSVLVAALVIPYAVVFAYILFFIWTNDFAPGSLIVFSRDLMHGIVGALSMFLSFLIGVCCFIHGVLRKKYRKMSFRFAGYLIPLSILLFIARALVVGCGCPH